MKCRSTAYIQHQSRRHTKEELWVWGDLQASQELGEELCKEFSGARNVSVECELWEPQG